MAVWVCVRSTEDEAGLSAIECAMARGRRTCGWGGARAGLAAAGGAGVRGGCARAGAGAYGQTREGDTEGEGGLEGVWGTRSDSKVVPALRISEQSSSRSSWQDYILTTRKYHQGRVGAPCDCWLASP